MTEPSTKPKSRFSGFKLPGCSGMALGPWQIVVLLGIAFSGLAAFVNTYNAISGIRRQSQACADSGDLHHKLNIQFIVLIVLAILAVLAGIALAWYLKSKNNSKVLLTTALATAGVFGIIYALGLKFQGVANIFKIGISWVAFIGFLIMGFLMSYNASVRRALTGC